jgi:hypothetical protein
MPVSCLLLLNLVIVFTLLIVLVAILTACALLGLFLIFRKSLLIILCDEEWIHRVGLVVRSYWAGNSEIKICCNIFPYSSFSVMRNKFIRRVTFIHRVCEFFIAFSIFLSLLTQPSPQGEDTCFLRRMSDLYQIMDGVNCSDWIKISFIGLSGCCVHLVKELQFFSYPYN